MQDKIKKLDSTLIVLNHKFRAYKDDVLHHAGWEHEEQANEKAKAEFNEAFMELFQLMLPDEHESNVRDLGMVTIYSPAAVEDFQQLLEAANLPCDKSNQN